MDKLPAILNTIRDPAITVIVAILCVYTQKNYYSKAEVDKKFRDSEGRTDEKFGDLKTFFLTHLEYLNKEMKEMKDMIRPYIQRKIPGDK
jgi:hypothetical protein